MSEIKDLVTKLRKAADILDELLGSYKHNETKKTAKRITRKLHWTQRPENKKRLRAILKKAAKQRGK